MNVMRLVVFGLTAFCFLNVAEAKPMESPSFDSLCAQTSNVIVAEYQSYGPSSPPQPIDYFDPPVAVYKRVQTMAGDETASEIRVRFDFHDGSACMAPSEWKFEPGQMPQRGARFILFLTEKNDKGTYSTYRGDFGRFLQAPDSYKIAELVQNCLRKFKMKKSHNKQVERIAH
jgi:hypothetical protein